MPIKPHMEHNLKKMSAANLEKLALTLGLTLVVAENGTAAVIEAIMAAELVAMANEAIEEAAPEIEVEAVQEEVRKPKRAVIIFPEIDEEDSGASEIRPSVNGRTIRIKRGHEVSIPIEHYEGSILKAIETRYVPKKVMVDGKPSTVEKEVPRFPHQFIRYEY